MSKSKHSPKYKKAFEKRNNSRKSNKGVAQQNAPHTKKNVHEDNLQNNVCAVSGENHYGNQIVRVSVVDKKTWRDPAVIVAIFALIVSLVTVVISTLFSFATYNYSIKKDETANAEIVELVPLETEFAETMHFNLFGGVRGSGLVNGIEYPVLVENNSEKSIIIDRFDVVPVSPNIAKYKNMVESITDADGNDVTSRLEIEAGKTEVVTFQINRSPGYSISKLIAEHFGNQTDINSKELIKYLYESKTDLFGNAVRAIVYTDKNLSDFYPEINDPHYPIYELSLHTSKGNIFKTSLSYEFLNTYDTESETANNTREAGNIVSNFFNGSSLFNIISFISAVISIAVGLYAVYQSYKYNKESDKLNNDTYEIMMHELEYNDVIIRNLRQLANTVNSSEEIAFDDIINFRKDSFELVKLSHYDSANKEAILSELEKLKIKKKSIEQIADFLSDKNRKRFEVNFFCDAERNDAEDFSKIYRVLARYYLLIHISYPVS